MISTHDIHWAAGFLEGEGCFDRGKISTDRFRGIRITAKQVDCYPLIKLQALFGGHLGQYQHGTKGDYIWVWTASARLAAQMMMTLYILMSPRRQDTIREALSNWKLTGPGGGQHKYKRLRRDKSN